MELCRQFGVDSSTKAQRHGCMVCRGNGKLLDSVEAKKSQKWRIVGKESEVDRTAH